MRDAYHASVVLLAGWILMLPPFARREGKTVVNDEAPIAKWEQDSAYDTAEACEYGRVEIYGHFQDKQDEHGMDRYTFARCVPSEAVYPSAPRPAPSHKK